MGERRRFWEKLFVNDRLAQSLANQDNRQLLIPPSSLLNTRWIIVVKWCWSAPGRAMPDC
jgi:uroporphyrin-III C-methyltransferase/precorrin-2 dehydrogenase/sirohydrochlorin ferrochelatase